jgi:hypothetical protein
MKEFNLINPMIAGGFRTSFKANDEFDAGKHFWEELTVDNNYIANNLPKFMFTLQEGSGKGLHHMMVKETLDKSGNVEYTINKLDNIILSQAQQKKFLTEVNRVRKNYVQEGGKKHSRRKRYKDDSSSDSDSSDYFDYLRLNRAKPIKYWWYAPTIYTIDGSYSVFTPTFTTNTSPYVQLWVPVP